MQQPNLFDINTKTVESETIVLYALGDFQARGKVLAERELALDRLRGAFKRAAEKYDAAEISDDAIAENLERLGAKIVRVPNFVAKHPFRVTISKSLAEKAAEFYKKIIKSDAETRAK